MVKNHNFSFSFNMKHQQSQEDCKATKRNKIVHTCHTSHCEIKSHRIFAFLEAYSQKIFQISQNFEMILRHLLTK